MTKEQQSGEKYYSEFVLVKLVSHMQKNGIGTLFHTLYINTEL